MQQLNPSALRSVSPLQRAGSSNVKLALFTNLDVPTQSQKSYRVKDATTLFDLINYLKESHRDCNIQLYANNQPILDSLNSYATYILQQYKISVFQYKAIKKIQESCIIQGTGDDDGPNLSEKLKNSASTYYTPSQQAKQQKRLQNYNSQDLSIQCNQSVQSQTTTERDIKSKPQSLYDSTITIQEIKCSCEKIYNSQTLSQLIVSAMKEDKFAKCTKCNLHIKRKMFEQLDIFQDYENFKNQKNYKIFYINITEYDLKDKNIRIGQCQNCKFICFWQKQLQIIDKKGFCPNCLCFTIDNPFK